MRHVTLEIPLRALATARRRQRYYVADPGVETLRDAFDDPTLARGIAAFEENHHLESLMHDPILQLDQFSLETKKLLEIEIPAQIPSFASALCGLGDQRIHAVVVDFHFQLFVDAVQHFGMYPAFLLPAVFGVVCVHGDSCQGC